MARPHSRPRRSRARDYVPAGGKVAVVLGTAKSARHASRRCAAGLPSVVVDGGNDPICALRQRGRVPGSRRVEDVVLRPLTSHHRDRQPRHQSPGTTARMEGQGDRRQHRPFRQRDRHAGLKNFPGTRRLKSSSRRRVQVSGWAQRDGARGGKPANLGCATATRALVIVGIFTNQVILVRAARAARKHRKYEGKKVYMLPKRSTKTGRAADLDHPTRREADTLRRIRRDDIGCRSMDRTSGALIVIEARQWEASLPRGAPDPPAGACCGRASGPRCRGCLSAVSSPRQERKGRNAMTRSGVSHGVCDLLAAMDDRGARFAAAAPGKRSPISSAGSEGR